MGTHHLDVLGKSYPINTNMTGFRCFSKIFGCALKELLAIALEGLVNSVELFDVHQCWLIKDNSHGHITTFQV